MKLAVREEVCSGCRVCQMVCSLANFGENTTKRAAIGIVARFPDPGSYEIKFCDQCGDCAQACPTGAIELVGGFYRINEEECNSCLACVDACPRGVMNAHPSSPVPFKCNLCGECVAFCPREAVYDAEAKELFRRWV